MTTPTITEVVEHLKSLLVQKGTESVVSIGWFCPATNNVAYMHKEFIDKCLDEIRNVVCRSALGETPTPLERLSIQLLMESARVEDFSGLLDKILSNRKTQPDEPRF